MILHPVLRKVLLSFVSSVCAGGAGKSGLPPALGLAFSALNRFRKTEYGKLIEASIIAPIALKLLQDNLFPSKAVPEKKEPVRKQSHLKANTLTGLVLVGGAFLFYGMTRVKKK